MTDQFTFDNPIIPGSIWDKKSDFTVPVVSPVGAGPKGDKGDMTGFDDLTEEQKSEIYAHVAAAGNKSIDAVYTTTGASTTIIEIPIADFDTFDMLFVDVNGLDLAENDDYTISGDSIVLATPLPAGQEVHFRALRYQLAGGDKTIVNTMGRHDYNTVAEMQADKKLKPGDICHTLGFYEVGDGGAAWYKIKAHSVANGMDVILCGDLFANLIYEEEMSIVQFGASTDKNDNSDYINYAFTKCRSLIIPIGRFKIKNSIVFPSDNLNIRGVDEINSVIENNEISNNAAMISIPIEYANFIIQNFTLNANNYDNRGIEALHPYDACVIRDMYFNNFTMAAIHCGYEDDSVISQTLYCENNLIYTSNTGIYRESPVILHRVYELNFSNNKILNRQISPFPCLLLSFIWDAYIRGNSFLQSAHAGIQVNGQLRYSRFIANTYENIGTEAPTNPQPIIEPIECIIYLNEDANAEIGSSAANVFIETPYYNSARYIVSAKNKLQKSSAFGDISIKGGSQNVSIGSYIINANIGEIEDGFDNNNVFFGNHGPKALFSNSIGIVNPLSKIQYFMQDSSSTTVDYGMRLFKRKNGQNTMLGQFERENTFELTQNGGQYRLRDANGVRYKIYVTTNGELRCDPL